MLPITQGSVSLLDEKRDVSSSSSKAKTRSRWTAVLAMVLGAGALTFLSGPSRITPDKTGLGALASVHTVNEHYPIQGLADSTNFYTALFRAASVEDL